MPSFPNGVVPKFPNSIWPLPAPEPGQYPGQMNLTDRIAAEIVAIETALGVNLANVDVALDKAQGLPDGRSALRRRLRSVKAALAVPLPPGAEPETFYGPAFAEITEIETALLASVATVGT